MEKFTKEQKEIINEMYNLQLDGSDFGARVGKAFAEVLKPETKKIVVKIECNYPKEFQKIFKIDYDEQFEKQFKAIGQRMFDVLDFGEITLKDSKIMSFIEEE